MNGLIENQKNLLIKMNSEKESHYQALVENSPDLMVRYDKQGRRLYVNQTYQRVTGMYIEALIGKTITANSVFYDFT